MIVREVISALRSYPEDLPMAAYSSHAEKPGEIENIVSCNNIIEEDRSFLVFRTSMYEGKSAAEVIGILLEHDESFIVAYDPFGFTFAYDLVECNTVRKVKCIKKKKTFHDIMDHTNYTEAVYKVSWRGREMLLIR